MRELLDDYERIGAVVLGELFQILENCLCTVCVPIQYTQYMLFPHILVVHLCHMQVFEYLLSAEDTGTIPRQVSVLGSTE